MFRSVLAGAFAAAFAFVGATPASAQNINQTVIATGLSNGPFVTGIAIDPFSGDLYLADNSSNKLLRVADNGGGSYAVPEELAVNAFASPSSVVRKANGDLLVGDHYKVWLVPGPDYDFASVTEFAAPAGVEASYRGLAIDGDGNIFIASSNAVHMLAGGDPNATTLIYTPQNFNAVGGIALDAQNNLLISELGQVTKLFAADGYDSNNAQAISGQGLGFVLGVGVDTSGHLYVGDDNNAGLAFFAAPDFGTNERLGASQLPSASGIAVDGSDNVFVHGTDGKLYRIAALPMVTGLSPSAGPEAGTNFISLVGKHFENPAVTNITINGQTPESYPAGNSALVRIPAGTGTVRLKISFFDPIDAHPILDVHSPDVPADVYTYVPAPVVGGLSQHQGPGNGHTSIIIAGANFTSDSVVKFGATAALSRVVGSSTQIMATSPPGTGTVDVTVTTAGGTSATGAADQFTYINPVITSVTPSAGPIGGGTPVVIAGSNFAGATSVTFGGVAASITINNGFDMTVQTPAHAAGAVDVVVTTPDGTGTATTAYEYVAAPTIQTVSPAAGPVSGGTAVTITGTDFTGDSTVTIDGTTVAVTVDSSTQLRVTTPAKSAGAATVAVTTPGGTATSSFTYVAAPTVTSVSPSAGPLAGGTPVTITGTNLTGATAVKFGANNASSVVVNSATSISATAPGGNAGQVTVSVTTAGGTGSKANAFTYAALPTVTSASPAGGPIAGNTTVTIHGTNLTGASAVKFGGTAATNISVTNATTLTAKTPAHAAGTVTVEVTTPGGTGNKGSAFTYYGVPTISAINPNQGPAKGGTQVAIVGTNLTGVTGVKFGATAAASFSVSSATKATATAPVHAVGAVNVTLTTPGGVSSAANGNKFTYTATPVLTTIAKFSASKADGSKPVGGLVADSTGALYGTTSQGGSKGLGTIFKLTPAGANFTKIILYHFDGLTGATPIAGLVIDSAKNLYGVTSAGGNKNKGVLFKYTVSTKKLTVLRHFQGTAADGGVPHATLARDAAGVLYGATTVGGTKGKGTTFTFKEPSTFKVTHHFAGGTDGANPQGAILLDSSKNVYGTTIAGGTPNQGMSYKIAPNGARTILHTFAKANTDGHLPRGGLFKVGSMLFGTTSMGGASNKGTVFEIMPPSTAAPLLFSFTGTNGANPYAGVVGDAATILYGTTFNGGASNKGVVFKLLPPANGQKAWSQSVLVSFKGSPNEGASPSAPVLLGKNRTLYGTTNGGGAAACAGGCGTVFKVTY